MSQINNYAKIIIKGKLPSRNEAERASRAGWQSGAKFKKQWQNYCAWQMRGVEPVKQPCKCIVTFYEENYRRDNDNVISGLKWALDALQQMKIIENDSHKLLRLIVNPVEVDRDNPRIEIELESLEKTNV